MQFRLKNDLTPNQRASVVYIYLNLAPSRLMNSAKVTSAIAAETRNYYFCK